MKGDAALSVDELLQHCRLIRHIKIGMINPTMTALLSVRL